MKMQDDQLVRALRALAEPNRLKIVEALAEKGEDDEMNCSQVLSMLNISQSTLSHHITELKEAELITAKPEGRTVILSLNQETFDRIKGFLSKF